MPKEDVPICTGACWYISSFLEGTGSKRRALLWEQQAGRLGTVSAFSASTPQCSVLSSQKVWELFSPVQRSFYSCLSEFIVLKTWIVSWGLCVEVGAGCSVPSRPVWDLDLWFIAGEHWERYCVWMGAIWIFFLEPAWPRISWMCRWWANWNLPRPERVTSSALFI